MTGRLLIAEAGRELYTLFANRTTQALDNRDLTRAYYSAVFDAVLRPGSAERRVLDLLGLAYFPLEVEIERAALGQSPETEISLGGILGFDKGDRIPLSITTTQETLKFLGNDNIARYEAFILTDDELIQIANILPPLGQTKTDFNWVATHNSDDLQRILVFVTTAFVPDQPIIGKSARIEQDRLELVGTFELSSSGGSTRTESSSDLPPPGSTYPVWLVNATSTNASSYQASVPVNAFYENGDWTFMPQSWNATATSMMSDDVSIVFHVSEHFTECYLRENTMQGSFSGAGIDGALGTIEAVAAGTKLFFHSQTVLTLGTSTMEWDWPCYYMTAGPRYGFEGSSGSKSELSGLNIVFRHTLDIFIDPTNPSTWAGSASTESGGATVSWSFTEVPEF